MLKMLGVSDKGKILVQNMACMTDTVHSKIKKMQAACSGQNNSVLIPQWKFVKRDAIGMKLVLLGNKICVEIRRTNYMLNFDLVPACVCLRKKIKV